NLPELKLDLDLMSVISGDQYKINSISLEKPRILARVLANGKANWDIVVASPPTKDATPTEATKFKLSLKKFVINNGHIVYDDASLGVYTMMDDMTYTLAGDFTQDNFLMKNDLNVERFTMSYGGMTYLSKVKTNVKAEIDMDMINWKFTFKDNEFNLNELGFGLDGFFAMPGNDYNMDLKFKAKQSEFKSFLSLIPGAYTKDFSSVKTSGKLAFDGFLKGLYSEEHHSMPGYGLNFQITDGSFQYPSVPKAVSAINIDCKIDDASGVTDQTIIDLKKFHVDFGGNPVDAGLHVSTPVSDANMDGWLKCKLDLATLKDVMPLAEGDQLNGKINADVKMKGRMSQIDKGQYDQFECSGTLGVLDMLYKTKDLPYDVTISGMDMSFTPQYVAVSKFDGKIGKNDIHADGRIDNLMTYLFKDSLLRGNFNMNSSLMDLNQFMGDAGTTAAATPDTSKMEVIQVPENIDFTLKSTIAKLIYTDINMDNVSGLVVLKNKTVDISDLKMNLMGGSMTVNGSYSTANPDVPKVSMDLDITDFDIQQTFKTFNTIQKLAPVSKYSKGKFSTKMNYTSDL
ncbi:MAG TPA: membrane assembly protein AsmA, partial [Bacteroidia bacterium]|nr:membrane assembly protein AsmA [Bacteroidia bacterium]